MKIQRVEIVDCQLTVKGRFESIDQEMGPVKAVEMEIIKKKEIGPQQEKEMSQTEIQIKNMMGELNFKIEGLNNNREEDQREMVDRLDQNKEELKE